MGGALMRRWTSAAPGATKERHDLPRGRAAHDGVVDDHQAAAADLFAQRAELHVDAALAHRLRWLDEGPAGVAVLDHALPVGQAAGLGIAGRGRGAGVGDRDDRVGVDRRLAGQRLAHPPPRLVEVATHEVRVRSGEVDELEDAEVLLRLGEADRARAAGLAEDDHLARLDLAHDLGADDVQGGRLGGDHPGLGLARDAAQDERPEAMRIADADDAVLVHDDQRVGARDLRQHGQQRGHDVVAGHIGEERREQLRVARATDALAAAGQAFEQLARVDQVAVVPDRHRPLGPQAIGRLGVLPEGRAGRRVAAVGDRQVAAQRWQAAFVEDLGDHAEVLVDHHALAVADGHAGRLLAAMLEREEGQRREAGRLLARGMDADDAAHRLRPPRRAPVAARTATRGRAPAASTSRASATPAPRSSAAPVARSPTRSMVSRWPPTRPSRRTGRPKLIALARQRLPRGRVDGHHDAARALAEEVDRWCRPDGDLQPGAEPRPDGALRERHGQAAAARRPGPRQAGRREPPPGATAGAPPRAPGRGPAARRPVRRRRAPRRPSPPARATPRRRGRSGRPPVGRRVTRRRSTSSSRPTMPIWAVGRMDPDEAAL